MKGAVVAVAASAGLVAPLPPDALSRSEAEALIEMLNGRLLASSSATATLTDWCAAHGLAEQPRIRAVLDRTRSVEASAELRARLGVGAEEPLVYRHVKLQCGDRVLSVAENWFVPARLDPETVRLLGETDIPFGAAIQGRSPSRRTVAAQILWHPLPEGREKSGDTGRNAEECEPVPRDLIRHDVLVLDRNGVPLAEVVETYQRDLLAFAVPWSEASARECGNGS